MRSILGTFWGTGEENEKAILPDSSETPDSIDDNGGADGARTRDLQRDRLNTRLVKSGLTIPVFRHLAKTSN